ncbi:MAG: hypothetical protein ABIG95_05140 [Candidatus Woesearchaeota archaeon]
MQHNNTNGNKVDNKEKKPSKQKKPIRKSFLESDGFLFEQVLRDGKNLFARYNISDSTVEYIESHVDKKGVWYVPQLGEEIEKGFIYLPSAAEEYTSQEKLGWDIRKFVRKWLEVSEEHLQYIVWNILKSWVFDKFETVSYLRVIGDYGTGKTRYLKTVGYLHYKPIVTSGATTSAPLFRVIDKWRGTPLIDEFDLRFSDETVELIKIVNLGFEKGSGIMRCDTNNPNIIKFFDPYCPKVIATRKPFEDKATESRCFSTVLDGMTRTDIPAELDSSFYEEAQLLRNKLLLWRFRMYNKIDVNAARNIDLGDIEPRLKQMNQGFVALFANEKDTLTKFKEFLLKQNENIVSERKSSMNGMIISAFCKLVFAEQQTFIAPGDIVREAELKDAKGDLLNPNRIAKNLKELGLDARKVCYVHGKAKNCIIWNNASLRRLAKRYGMTVKEPSNKDPF